MGSRILNPVSGVSDAPEAGLEGNTHADRTTLILLIFTQKKLSFQSILSLSRIARKLFLFVSLKALHASIPR